MDEYVSKEAFIKRFDGMNMSWVITMLDIFKRFPAADVAPVRHGRWVPVSNTGIGATGRCTVCNKAIYGFVAYNYCPNCGAKMDLEVISE